MKLVVLSPDDKLAEIRRLYFATTRETIGQDLDRALQLLKSMESEEERERAAVYMEGLAEMRGEWAKQAGRKSGRNTGTGKNPRPGKPERKPPPKPRQGG